MTEVQTVTPDQVRQLAIDIAAYQVHFLLHGFIGDDWTNLAESVEIESEIAQNFIGEIDHLLTPLAVKITDVDKAHEHCHELARIIAQRLNEKIGIGETDINLSTSALDEVRLARIENE